MPLMIGTDRALLIAPPFNPRSLGNLVLWLDASKLKYAPAQLVSNWFDASENGKPGTQATGSKQPTFQIGVLNGRPVVRFAGDDTMDIPAIDLTGTTVVSVYMVVTNISGTGDRMMLEMSANQGAQIDSFFFDCNTSNKLSVSSKGDVGSSDFASTPAINTTKHQLGAIYNKALTTFEATGFVDGSSAGGWSNNANNTNAFGNRVLYLGSRGGASMFSLGDIAEVLLYSVAHDSATRQLIEAYLKSKWGTP